MTRPLGVGAPRQSVVDVLDFAWRPGAFTANDVPDRLDLTRATTIRALDELIELGLVEDRPTSRDVGDYQKGRPARRFEFAACAGSLVGVDAGSRVITVAVADLLGRVHTRHQVPLGRDAPVGVRRATIVRAVDETLTLAGVPGERIASLCVGVPAPVDLSGRSPATGEFWPTINPGLIDLFADRAPIVHVENDACLAAQAERWFGAGVGHDNMVALLADAGALPGDHPLARLPDPTAQQVLRHAGDPALRPVIERVGLVVARVAGLLGSVHDSGRIVICGAIAAGIEPVLEHARTVLADQLDLPAPELVASGLGSDVVATGGIASAMEHARTGLLGVVLGGRFTTVGRPDEERELTPA